MSERYPQAESYYPYPPDAERQLAKVTYMQDFLRAKNALPNVEEPAAYDDEAEAVPELADIDFDPNRRAYERRLYLADHIGNLAARSGYAIATDTERLVQDLAA